MSWMYRKRIKIAPGVHINLGKNGISTSVGVRGASMTFGKNGTYVNTGIPGTGLYSRKKISGNMNSCNSSSNYVGSPQSPYTNNKTKLENKFILGLIGLVLEIFLISLLWNPYNLEHDTTSIAFLIILILLWGGIDFMIFRSVVIAYARKPSNYGYEYLVQKYNESETRVIEQADAAINEMKQVLEDTNDDRKIVFIQSFINSHKNYVLTRLFRNSKSFIDIESQDLDPLFSKVANVVVQKQSDNYSDLYKIVPDCIRYCKICHQLVECGIVDVNFETGDTSVMVKELSDLKYLLKKANGKSLLSKEEKKLKRSSCDHRSFEDRVVRGRREDYGD